MRYISVIELKEKLDNNLTFTLLDVREDYEIEICSIGGLHIPMADVIERIAEIPRDTEVAVLCRSGKRAQSVANLLENDLEYSNVTIVDGGILAWIEEIDSQLEAY